MDANFRVVRLPLSNVDGGLPFVIQAAPYLINDVVGGLGRVYYKHVTDGGLVMRGVAMRDTAKKDIPYDLHIYKSAPGGSSPIDDNDPFAPSVADGDLEIGIVTIEAGRYKTVSGGAYSKAYKEITDVEIDMESDGEFYVYLECLAAVTPISTADLLPEFVFWANR